MMGDPMGEALPGGRPAMKFFRRQRSSRRHRMLYELIGVLRRTAFGVSVCLLGLGALHEARTSWLQARFFLWFDSGIRYWVAAGTSASLHFPLTGPRNVRLGYAGLPVIVPSLEAHNFEIVRQARWSRRLDWFVGRGGYALYTPKAQTGLEILDRTGVQMFKARYPQRIYRNYGEVPPLVANSLMFIEDRHLLDARYPERDPAVQWNRFLFAALWHIAGSVDRHWQEGGASTLATQMVKFDDSFGGRTQSVGEKLRQMFTAAADAYRNGPDTMMTRRNILLRYLNSTPLASRPGYGEIIGLPEALWAWYSTDLAEADKVLTQPALTSAAVARQGEIYRQVLSLILAGQRPAYYLIQNRAALETLTSSYLPALARVGIISYRLRNAATRPLQFQSTLPPSPDFSFVDHKATDSVQAKLLSLLHVQSLWALHRFDLTVNSTIDEATQQQVTNALTHLGDPTYDRSLGLVGRQMLGGGNPALVDWSFVLYQRGNGANYVRVHADSLNEPFDINSGAKLQLGSTAKLRTLITYLDIVVSLHRELASEPAPDLRQITVTAPDALTRWAAGYLAGTSNRTLKPMLNAAMQRTYSAAPVTFFTGGGDNTFDNFRSWENSLAPTVEVAFENSINCAFVRLMRDIRDYYIAQLGINESRLLSDRGDPARIVYLRKFAEEEGLNYLYRFYTEDQGLTPTQVLTKLAGQTKPLASHLAVIFLAVRPDASQGAMTAFLKAYMPATSFREITHKRLVTLYDEFDAGRFSLNDEGYIAGIHPLALWLACYLQSHPAASWSDIVKASPAAIRQSYVWLFKRGKTYQQNVRIRTVLEQDAFQGIWHDWRRLGYPFDHLVPSLGTALGASGDRPDALANLMGIIVNDGVRQPTVDIDRLAFGDGTPYQTDFATRPVPRRVLNPLVAETVRRALLGVVQNGTAKPLDGTYDAPNGSPLSVGGKTGSGDNRYHVFGPGGYARGERVVDRTATFVFFLGDKFFGTVVAYVPGIQAAKFHFTSALAVKLLKVLQPQLNPLLKGPVAARSSMAFVRDKGAKLSETIINE